MFSLLCCVSLHEEDAWIPSAGSPPRKEYSSEYNKLGRAWQTTQWYVQKRSATKLSRLMALKPTKLGWPPMWPFARRWRLTIIWGNMSSFVTPPFRKGSSKPTGSCVWRNNHAGLNLIKQKKNIKHYSILFGRTKLYLKIMNKLHGHVRPVVLRQPPRGRRVNTLRGFTSKKRIFQWI